MSRLIVLLLLSLAACSASPVNYVGFTSGVPALVVSVTGSGTVTSSPAGINCTSAGGSGCTTTFAPSTSVTLTATPAPSTASSSVNGTGTQLTLWGGAACTGQTIASPCTLTFTGATNAAATFNWFDSDIWWVNPSTGSDTLNTGRSILSPYLTNHKAFTQMARGDTLYDDVGTYLGITQCVGCFNGNTNPSDIPNGTSLKNTRILSNTPQGATIDGAYVNTSVRLFQRSYIEVGYFNTLHGGISVDGSTGASGSSLTFTLSGGTVPSITIGAGGSGYSTAASNLVTIFGLTCTTYPEYTFTVSGGGAVNATTQVRAGSGCTEKVTGASGASVDMKASTIWIHDNAVYSTSNGADSGTGCNRCANSTFSNNWTWGFGPRYGIVLFAGVWNVARQNVGRFDGYSGTDPIAAVSLYSEDYSIVENNIAVDFTGGVNTNQTQAFFNTSSSTLSAYPYGMGTGSFLGNVALNVYGANPVPSFRVDNLQSMSSTPAGGVTPVITFRNNVSAVNNNTANNIDMITWTGDGTASTHGMHHEWLLDLNTAYNKNPGTNSDVNMVRFYTSAGVPSFITYSNSVTASPGNTTVGCYRSDTSVNASNNVWNACNNTLYTPVPSSTHTDPVFTWLLRPGSATPSVGATVNNQYVNGTLTGTALWPFANEAAIKNSFCTGPDDYTSATINATSFGASQSGKRFIITTAGSTTWTALGAAANTAGTIFTSNGGTGSGTGIAQPYTYTRGQNLTYWCAGGLTLTQYVWQTPLGNASPY